MKPTPKPALDLPIRFDAIPACDRQTDRHTTTAIVTVYRVRLSIPSIAAAFESGADPGICVRGPSPLP